MAGFWMVRAGEGGYLFEKFELGYIAIGWSELGDLSSVHSQDDIRNLYEKAYPGEKLGKVASAMAVIYKFRAVIEIGDKVVTYDPATRKYLVGTVKSDYIHSPSEIIDDDYVHTRKVSWEGSVSRDDLSASSRNSLGGALTLFSINEEVWAEISSTLTGHAAPAKEERVEEEKDELEQIREDIIGKANEFIKDKILDLSAEELERLSAAILRAMGYRARVSPPGPDRGVDVTASRDGLGLEQPRIKAEVKHRSNTPMGSQEIRSFLGGLREGDRGLYISTGGFTKDAKYEADRSNIPVTLLDLDDLVSLIVTHYENFDLDGRVLIPLVKVYWPAD